MNQANNVLTQLIEKTKDKYEHGHLNNKRQYWTRHLTWTRQRCLFKNKGNSVYNYKLKKF